MTLSTTKRSISGPGIVLSALAALFMAFDAIVHLIEPDQVREAMAKLGYPDVARTLGAIVLVGVALYIYKRTAPLGAVLLTGYLGGAVASHVRVGDPLVTHVLMPVYVATMLWGGLYLRDDRVRRLVAR